MESHLRRNAPPLGDLDPRRGGRSREYGVAAHFLHVLLCSFNHPPYCASQIDELILQKFQYVVACQVFGRMKKNQDPKADDIEMLLRRFPSLRVAYIDEVRVDAHDYLCVAPVLHTSLPIVQRLVVSNIDP